MKRIGLFVVLGVTACLSAENMPCQRDAECAATFCYITDTCRALTTCYGACRTSCSGESPSCPRGQICECAVRGTPDAGGCACLTIDAGVLDGGGG